MNINSDTTIHNPIINPQVHVEIRVQYVSATLVMVGSPVCWLSCCSHDGLSPMKRHSILVGDLQKFQPRSSQKELNLPTITCHYYCAGTYVTHNAQSLMCVYVCVIAPFPDGAKVKKTLWRGGPSQRLIHDSNIWICQVKSEQIHGSKLTSNHNVIYALFYHYSTNSLKKRNMSLIPHHVHITPPTKQISQQYSPNNKNSTVFSGVPLY